MIDAAGAIYVIGGTNGTAYFNDVLVSTDGGAHQTRKCWGRHSGVLGDTLGYCGGDRSTRVV